MAENISKFEINQESEEDGKPNRNNRIASAIKITDIEDFKCVCCPPVHIAVPPIHQITSCGHLICTPCLDKHLIGNKNATCPGSKSLCSTSRLGDEVVVRRDKAAERELQDAYFRCPNRCGSVLRNNEVNEHLRYCQEVNTPAHIEVSVGDLEMDDNLDQQFIPETNLKRKEKSPPLQIISSLDKTSLNEPSTAERSGNQQLRLLLLGKTGAGKSALGNTLLGEDCFFSSGEPTYTVTSHVKKVSKEVEGINLTLVDTPGVMDTKEESSTMDEIAGAIAHNDQGYDAFLFVMRYPIRLTREEIESLQKYKTIFGPNFGKHAIIVFTGADMLEKEMKRKGKVDNIFEEYVENNRWSNARDALSFLFRLCTAGWIFINNFEESEEKNQRQVNELLILIDRVKTLHGTWIPNLNYSHKEPVNLNAHQSEVIRDSLQCLNLHDNGMMRMQASQYTPVNGNPLSLDSGNPYDVIFPPITTQFWIRAITENNMEVSCSVGTRVHLYDQENGMLYFDEIQKVHKGTIIVFGLPENRCFQIVNKVEKYYYNTLTTPSNTPCNKPHIIHVASHFQFN